MDENVKNDAKQVMLVQNADDGRLQAVTGVDQDGNIQTADPTDQNVASLLNVNTQDSALEAFFKKFMEQAQNPVHTGIFVMTENALNKLIRIDFDPEILENYRIDPSERLQTQEQRQFEPLDVTKIDLADMEKKGIRMEDIEPHLKAMSYGHKSNGLVEMNPELENGMRVSTKGRVSLEEQADGSLRVVPHYWQGGAPPHAPPPPAPRHTKRYQDIQELLRAGINVYTTVNVQHLESLNDVVASITGISVSERVPDNVFDSAYQVEVVDLEPADLLERLREGKIYRGPQAAQALDHFFSLKNLASLREIALRRTADQLESSPRFQGEVKPKAGEHILICLSGAPSNAKVIRTAARMAKAFHGAFTALFVETSDFASQSEQDRKRLRDHVHLAEELGARIATAYGDDPAVQIAEYARISGISKVVLGRSPRKRGFTSPKNLVDRLNELAPDLDLYIIPDQTARQSKRLRRLRQSQEKFSPKDLAKMLGILLLCTLGGALFSHWGFANSNVIMLYILGVLGIAMVTTGRSYSVAASVLSVLIFNFFFTHPYFTFMSDPSYIATFGVMFVVAFLGSSLTTRMKRQARLNAEKAYRTAILLETSQKLQKAEGSQAILALTAHQLNKLLDRDLVIYQREENGELSPTLFPVSPGTDLSEFLTESERGVAEWVFKNNKHAGATTNTLPSAKCLYMSIRGTGGALAVAAIVTKNREKPEAFEKNFMVAILDECGLALEKEMTVREKQAVEERAHQETLRANLLRAISHDLRTPLTSISGNANILMEGRGQLCQEKLQALYTAIYDDSMWLIDLVENLLSITRIEDDKLGLKTQPELLEEIFQEALQHLDRNASQHQISVELEDDLLMANVDARLLVQVVINIVNNAIKYTPEGSHITLSAHREGDQVEVEIADDGPGIDQDAKDRIFDMFYTADKKRGDSRRGLGLGLSLCKSIINAHGGTIQAVDNHPQGTIFRFTLGAVEETNHE